MIVVDASVVVELLLQTSRAAVISDHLGDSPLHAPELIDIEILHVLRRYRLRERLSPARVQEAIADLVALRIDRHSHEPYLFRIWELHRNVTAYDAAYISLAEAIDAPLLTLDARLSRSTGHSARIEVPA